MIGAAFYTRNAEVERAQYVLEVQLQSCQKSSVTTNYAACLKSANELFQQNFAHSSVTLAEIMVNALGPVILGWVIVFIAIGIVRWVRAGFAKPKS